MKIPPGITRRGFIILGLAAVPVVRAQKQGTNCILTEDNVQGLFYHPHSPWKTALCEASEPGKKLTISGTVTDADNCGPLVKATLDVWQANDRGDYKNDTLRGKMYTDDKGRFSFQTIVPGNYQEKPEKEVAFWRASHIHFIVEYSGYKTLTTQCYFQGDGYLRTDRYVKRSQVLRLETDNASANSYRGVFNVVLERQR